MEHVVSAVQHFHCVILFLSFIKHKTRIEWRNSADSAFSENCIYNNYNNNYNNNKSKNMNLWQHEEKYRYAQQQVHTLLANVCVLVASLPSGHSPYSQTHAQTFTRTHPRILAFARAHTTYSHARARILLVYYIFSYTYARTKHIYGLHSYAR